MIHRARLLGPLHQQDPQFSRRVDSSSYNSSDGPENCSTEAANGNDARCGDEGRCQCFPGAPGYAAVLPTPDDPHQQVADGTRCDAVCRGACSGFRDLETIRTHCGGCTRETASNHGRGCFPGATGFPVDTGGGGRSEEL